MSASYGCYCCDSRIPWTWYLRVRLICKKWNLVLAWILSLSANIKKVNFVCWKKCSCYGNWFSTLSVINVYCREVWCHDVSLSLDALTCAGRHSRTCELLDWVPGVVVDFITNVNSHYSTLHDHSVITAGIPLVSNVPHWSSTCCQ